MLQSVVDNIRQNGAPIQWSADITEHGHITEVKDPARQGNNQNYESQIVRALDRKDKLQRFDLSTSIRAAGVHFGPQLDYPDHDSDDDEDFDEPHHINTTNALLETIHPMSSVAGPKRRAVDYFAAADRLTILASDGQTKPPFPLRIFTFGATSFHLARDPSFSLAIDEASVIFNLPDLRQALTDYSRDAADPGINMMTSIVGTRRTSLPGCNLPFDSIRVWPKIRMQTKTFHDSERVAEPRTVMAAPPSKEWRFGQCDTVLVSNDPGKQWPASGYTGNYSVNSSILY